ncbi:hypothetical protein MJO28_016286, partial [Puccinia striiformis f. sp. tritici]
MLVRLRVCNSHGSSETEQFGPILRLEHHPPPPPAHTIRLIAFDQIQGNVMGQFGPERSDVKSKKNN